jgi:hypothetical protein
MPTIIPAVLWELAAIVNSILLDQLHFDQENGQDCDKAKSPSSY